MSHRTPPFPPSPPPRWPQPRLAPLLRNQRPPQALKPSSSPARPPNAAWPKRPTPSAWSMATNCARAGPQINLSEAIARVPGLVVANRNNYAQDLQISSRGFGARAGFGVRGLRLYTDGIPASGPDGQGQVSHFDLAGIAARGSAARAVLGALRQQLGRRDRHGVGPGARGPRRSGCRRRQLRPAADPPGRGRADLAANSTSAPPPRRCSGTASGRKAKPRRRPATCAWAGSRATTAWWSRQCADQPADDPAGPDARAVRCRPAPDHAARPPASTRARSSSQYQLGGRGATASRT